LTSLKAKEKTKVGVFCLLLLQRQNDNLSETTTRRQSLNIINKIRG
jgi:hypothetical protein